MSILGWLSANDSCPCSQFTYLDTYSAEQRDVSRPQHPQFGIHVSRLWSEGRTVGPCCPAWALPPSWPAGGGVPATRPHLCGSPCPRPPTVRGGAATGPAEARRVHVLHGGGPGCAVRSAHPHPALVRPAPLLPFGVPSHLILPPSFPSSERAPWLIRPETHGRYLVGQRQALVLCCSCWPRRVGMKMSPSCPPASHLVSCHTLTCLILFLNP